MSSIHVLFKGLCLWLPAMMNQMGGLPVIVPDFTGQVNAHSAALIIPKASIVGGVCPAGFGTADPCVYELNGKGQAGGVTIDFLTGVSTSMPDPICSLCLIPPVQHQRDFTLKPEYMPGTGTALAAALVLNQGFAVSRWDPETCLSTDGDCPRFVDWSVSAPSGNVRLRLSNLAGGAPDITVELTPDASVTVRNQPPPQPAALHSHAQRLDTPDWCLYFTLFEGNPGCPGAPPIILLCPPGCVPIPAAAHKTKKRPHFGMGIDTIACSNSHYP